MAEAERIEALKMRHANLERHLEEERLRPLPDAAVIAEIKRQKLAIKDEIAYLRH